MDTHILRGIGVCNAMDDIYGECRIARPWVIGCVDDGSERNGEKRATLNWWE